MRRPHRTAPFRTALLLAAALLTLTLAYGLSACRPAVPVPPGPPLPETVDFNLHVRPILSDRCFACHGPDANKREADLRLDTEAGAFETVLASGGHAVVPGSLRRSRLVARILSDDPDEMMPPPASNLALTDREKALLARWVEQGAVWKPHWSLIPPEKPAPPAVGQAGWPRNEIDRFVLARLEGEGWEPAPEAGPEVLLRRVTFDLTGLPPTLEEIDAFLADRSPDAYEKAVDRLLASDAYGERMAAEWLDVARYADTHGYQDDGMRTMWPWREWVIRAFNDNMPYDAFVTWQLAGDLLPEPTQAQRLATAFNRNHLQSQEGGIVSEEYRVEYVADRVQTLGRAFLGVTLECARCHDHKYDPVTQKEYYQLFGFFNNVNETGQIPYAGEASPTVILTDAATDERLASLRAEIAALEARVDPASPAFDDGFDAWRAAGPASLQPPQPIARYPLDALVDRHFANTVDRSRPATLQGDRDRLPETVEGRAGGAQRLVGASFIDLGPDLAYFERNEPFSVDLWVKLEADSVAGPLFTKSGGTFNGNRGYEVILREDGTLTAGLHHVWPDDGLEIETTDRLTPRAWHHLALTYDGSSRAAGLRLYLDGRPMAARVLTDHLRQSILHHSDGTNWGGSGNLCVGRRFEETIEDVSVDELGVYDRRLTAPEVALLAGAADPFAAASEADLRDHYAARHAPSYAAVLAELTRLRGEENAVLTSLTQVMVMRERRDVRPTFVLARGAYDAPAERVEPGTPAVLPAFPDDLPRDRLGLARWLLDPRHPLTARVTVNRYWQLFFGRGLVETPEDFGSQGALPTHPALLDWLATTFVDDGWDLKALHRRIVTSATYRQSSVVEPARRAADPGNALLARGPSHRLPAEMIRDQALAASGLLVLRLGGPSVRPYQPPGLWKELATRNATEYVQDEGEGLYRRSLYTIWKRTSPPPSMISLDASERLYCVVRRQRTSTPLQALLLMNDPQYVEAARLVAERMVREGGPETAARLALGFRLLTGRAPRPDEAALLAGLYAAEHAGYRADPAAAQALLATGAHPRDERLDPAEVAALTVVASTILNFDESVMKR